MARRSVFLVAHRGGARLVRLLPTQDGPDYVVIDNHTDEPIKWIARRPWALVWLLEDPAMTPEIADELLNVAQVALETAIREPDLSPYHAPDTTRDDRVAGP